MTLSQRYPCDSRPGGCAPAIGLPLFLLPLNLLKCKPLVESATLPRSLALPLLHVVLTKRHDHAGLAYGLCLCPRPKHRSTERTVCAPGIPLQPLHTRRGQAGERRGTRAGVRHNGRGMIPGTRRGTMRTVSYWVALGWVILLSALLAREADAWGIWDTSSFVKSRSRS